MNKQQTSKLLNKIKGYYNSQFFIDEYVLDAWTESLKPYELEDSIEHLQKYLKEYPDIAPKPHTFIKGLYTPEEKQKMKNANYTVQCNLCQKWMPLSEYDSHYGRCLDIQYLVSVAKQKGENIKREDLEVYSQETIDKLLKKYEPKNIDLQIGDKKIVIGG